MAENRPDPDALLVTLPTLVVAHSPDDGIGYRLRQDEGPG